MQTKLQPSTTYRAVLGKALELQRNSLQLNQKDVAKALQTSQSAWSRVETGQSSLSVEELVAAAHVLKSRPEDVLQRVQHSIEYLQERGVQVLMRSGKSDGDTAAALLGAAALGALLVAILAAGKK